MITKIGALSDYIVPRAGLEPKSLAFPRYTHAYMSMQLLASEVSAGQVSADYYTRPIGIVSHLILTITYIQAMALHIKHIVGSTTIQHVACT